MKKKKLRWHITHLRRVANHAYEAGKLSAQPRIDALESALRFYADPISYIPTQMKEPRTAVHWDGGANARSCLYIRSDQE